MFVCADRQGIQPLWSKLPQINSTMRSTAAVLSLIQPQDGATALSSALSAVEECCGKANAVSEGQRIIGAALVISLLSATSSYISALFQKREVMIKTLGGKCHVWVGFVNLVISTAQVRFTANVQMKSTYFWIFVFVFGSILHPLQPLFQASFSLFFCYYFPLVSR